jgi:ACR3 family arsenite efflux pump ArsB
MPHERDYLLARTIILFLIKKINQPRFFFYKHAFYDRKFLIFSNFFRNYVVSNLLKFKILWVWLKHCRQLIKYQIGFCPPVSNTYACFPIMEPAFVGGL